MIHKHGISYPKSILKLCPFSMKYIHLIMNDEMMIMMQTLSLNTTLISFEIRVYDLSHC